jgi:hydrogenase nickel incorporation protein HypB
MCGVCGCADKASEVTMTDMETGDRVRLRGAMPAGLTAEEAHAYAHAHGLPHDHAHEHDHGHPHHHGGHGHAHPVAAAGGGVVALEAAILARNDAMAARNRGWFEGRGVFAINLVSSPGAGKTTLIEASVRALAGRLPVSVIEGDQMTTNDAERVRAAGARAVQINTGAGCHLEADMVAEAVRALDPAPGTLLIIENVGNLVCPAMFDLGESLRVAVVSVTEGEDKPLKYPHIFRSVRLVVVNKMDLAPHTGFDEAACLANIRAVNPSAEILCLSARTGQNMEPWLAKLIEISQDNRAAAGSAPRGQDG